MKMRKCWRCWRHRPLKKLNFHNDDLMFLCKNNDNCWRAFHRLEMKVARWILSDHDEKDRKGWRQELEYHRSRLKR